MLSTKHETHNSAPPANGTSGASRSGRVDLATRPWTPESAFATLVNLPVPVREQIVTAYRARGGTFAGAWDKPTMSLLAAAIFGAENDIEHRAMSVWPPIAKLRAIADDLRVRRNALYDATGENERPSAEVRACARNHALGLGWIAGEVSR